MTTSGTLRNQGRLERVPEGGRYLSHPLSHLLDLSLGKFNSTFKNTLTIFWSPVIGFINTKEKKILVF